MLVTHVCHEVFPLFSNHSGEILLRLLRHLFGLFTVFVFALLFVSVFFMLNVEFFKKIYLTMLIWPGKFCDELGCGLLKNVTVCLLQCCFRFTFFIGRLRMDAKEFLEKNGLSCLTELIVEDK